MGHALFMTPTSTSYYERFTYFFLFSEGEEWHRQRVPMSKFAMVPQNVAKFHEEFNAIIVDLLTKIQRQKDPNTQVLSDLPNLLNKWSFECECEV